MDIKSIRLYSKALSFALWCLNNNDPELYYGTQATRVATLLCVLQSFIHVRMDQVYAFTPKSFAINGIDLYLP